MNILDSRVSQPEDVLDFTYCTARLDANLPSPDTAAFRDVTMRARVAFLVMKENTMVKKGDDERAKQAADSAARRQQRCRATGDALLCSSDYRLNTSCRSNHGK